MSSRQTKLLIEQAIAVSCLLLGLYFIQRKHVHSANVVGKVAKVDSVPGAHGGEITKLTVNYQMGTTSLTGVVNGKSRKSYSVGDTVVIYYNPSSPGDLTLTQMPSKPIGIALIALSAIIFVGSSRV